MENRVFLSHSNEDRDVARRVLSHLVRLGFAAWHDGLISPGENWAVEVRRGLDQSSAVLFLVSPHSASSAHSLSELRYAIDQDKDIFPLLVAAVGPDSIPSELSGYDLIDAVGIDDADLGARLEEQLGARLQSEQSEQNSLNKGYVFLSYANPDSDFAERLKTFLREKGYGYWDYEESDRDYHSQLFLELEEAILASAAVFSILSEDWKRSRWSVREYFFAEEAGIPVFLLRPKALGPTLAVAGMPYINFEHDESEGFRKLSRELERKGL
jgi:hypothetical protein